MNTGSINHALMMNAEYLQLKGNGLNFSCCMLQEKLMQTCNLNNAEHFRNEREEHLRGKVSELEREWECWRFV
jgi:hypothetical protein